MRTNLTILYDKFDALKIREKYMVSGLILILLTMLWLTQISDKMLQHYQVNSNTIKNLQQKTSTLSIEISAYKDRRLNNPNLRLKKEKQDYLNKIELFDVKLNKKMKGLITPKMMTLMLRDIFINNKSLTLLSLENLKTEEIYDINNQLGINNKNKIKLETTGHAIIVTDHNNIINKSAVLYRHPVRIIFTGSYINTLKYLEKIEQMPWDIYWDTVKFDVEKYPKSKIIITVFTLSLKKGWIGV